MPNTFPPIVPGVTTGAQSATALNALGADSNVAFQFTSAFAEIENEIAYFTGGTIVYCELQDAYYQYDGADWILFNLPTHSNLGSMAFQDADNVAITGGSIASNDVNLLDGGLADENVLVPIKLGSATDTSLATDKKSIAGAINEIHAALSYFSAGILGTPATLHDNGDGTADISSFDVLLFDNANFDGEIRKFTVDAVTLTFIDGAEEYVAVKYNAGTPVTYKETVGTLMNNSDIIPIFVVWRVGTVVHSLGFDSLGNGLPNKLQSAAYHTKIYAISTDGGLVITESVSPNPRTIMATGALVYTGAIPNLVGAFDSSADTMTMAYHSAGNWVYANQLVYDNTHYDNGTALITMDAGKFGVMWFYRSIGDVKQVFYVAGTVQYDNAAAAAGAIGRTDLPPVIKKHCILIGRAVIQKSATSGNTQSAFGTFFGGSEVISHNSTSFIQGGAPGDYLHITQAEAYAMAAQRKIVATSIDYVMTINDGTVLVNASTGVRNVTLPPSATAYNSVSGLGMIVRIKKVDGTPNFVHITGDATVDGDTTTDIISKNACVTMQCFSTGWYIV